MATKAKKKAAKSVDARAYLERKLGPMTIGGALSALRLSDELSQAEFARRLGVSAAHLCDVEKGRRTVSPARAAKWAEVLGQPAVYFVRLALQGELDAAGLKLRVGVEAA